MTPNSPKLVKWSCLAERQNCSRGLIYKGLLLPDEGWNQPGFPGEWA